MYFHKNTESTEYISDLSIQDGEHNIFWLDFVSPSELGTQLSDYSTLLNLLNPDDIVRITLNANPDSLGKSKSPDQLQELRLQTLRNRVPDSYLWPSISSADVTTKISSHITENFKSGYYGVFVGNPPYSPNFMLPLFSSIYADGQQMVTFTGIV